MPGSDNLARPTMLTIPPHIRGLIFDCDGTVADTMPLHYRAWVAALGEHDVDFPEAFFYELAGMPTINIIELLNERHGRNMPVEATAERKESLYLASVSQVLPIAPVVAVARAYHGKMPMAVATGGGRW
jgi:beta-phosphoglucomutase-like phosphatase (HAD superfamily)